MPIMSFSNARGHSDELYLDGVQRPGVLEMSDASKSVRIVLVEEYDEESRSTVLEVLRELSAPQPQRSSGVGGSQRVETLSLRVGEREIVIETETYIGLSITGDPALVDDVARSVRGRLPRI
jgi:hypothetical protein